jgi:hypothetical protein
VDFLNGKAAQPNLTFAFEPRLHSTRPATTADGAFTSVRGDDWRSEISGFAPDQRTFWYVDAWHALAGHVANHSESQMNRQRKKRRLEREKQEQSCESLEEKKAGKCDLLLVHLFDGDVALDAEQSRVYLFKPYMEDNGRLELKADHCELAQKILDRVFVRFGKPSLVDVPFGTSLPELGVVEVWFVETKTSGK